MVSLLAAAGVIEKGGLWPVLNAPLVAVRFLTPARLMLRSLNVARPVASVARVVVPLRLPLPAALAAVPTVLLSLLRRLPKASSIRMTGCWMKATPAVAVADGWV